MSVSWIKYNPK